MSPEKNQNEGGSLRTVRGEVGVVHIISERGGGNKGPAVLPSDSGKKRKGGSWRNEKVKVKLTMEKGDGTKRSEFGSFLKKGTPKGP